MKIHYVFLSLLFSVLASAQTFTEVTPITVINTEVGDSYPWISGDGLRLYYTSGEGASSSNIYFTERANTSSDFGTPSILQTGVTEMVVSIWLSADEKDAYFTTFDAKLYFAHRENTTTGFNNPTLISLTGSDQFFLFKGPSLNADQTKMMLNTFNGQIIELTRTSSTSFAYTNTISIVGKHTGPGQLSKDELSYFFSVKVGSGLGKLGRMTRAAVTDSFDVNSYVEIQGVDDEDYSEVQPSVSNNLDWMVFVRNVSNVWGENDIYIARNANLSIAEPQQNSAITVFPNPSEGIINISDNAQFSGSCKIELWNMLGKLVVEQPFTNQLDLSGYAKGMYFLKINGEGISETRKIVLK